MVQRMWELTEEMVRQMAALAPEGFLDYESNQETWREFCNQLWDNDFLNEGLGIQRTPQHPDYK